ncbi:hypothetical protein DFH08DRAFT_930354 [Mycena albidolilacea]|uniref:Uncharacterized protein n=1 Tax=Mycena albidolilacea TaxID=1033008 RepID=A0AAD7F4B3_9AGAR|nr:hypothetical protein DFH08DRAFT_930354 [Mycena albidolilacea]
MLPSSQSESSGLAGRKRKAAEVHVEHLLSKNFTRMRQEALFSAFEEDEWEKVVARILDDPELRPNKVTVSPFTEALPFFEDLCGSPKRLDIREDLDRASEVTDGNMYEDAARNLQENILWRGVREHVVMEKEMSCRTAIDLILLTAVDLAQRHISEKPELDDALRIRHDLDGPARREPDGRHISSWVVVQQEVDIPSQLVRQELAFHGILDYLLAIVPAKDGQSFLSALDVHGSPGAIVDHKVSKVLGAIIEAKAENSMDSSKAWAQVAAKRLSVISTLTDGVRWCFFQIHKEPDQGLPSHEHSAATQKKASAAKKSPENNRRSSLRSASKSAALPAVSEGLKPFSIAATRTLDILHHDDLAIVLRLLTLSILETPEKFGELASGVGLS